MQLRKKNNQVRITHINTDSENKGRREYLYCKECLIIDMKNKTIK